MGSSWRCPIIAPHQKGEGTSVVAAQGLLGVQMARECVWKALRSSTQPARTGEARKDVLVSEQRLRLARLRLRTQSRKARPFAFAL